MRYGIVVVTAIFYATVSLHFEYTPDASYVSFRVATNLVDGEGLVFNRGELSAGTSGPLWSLILAGGVWGGLDAPLVAKTFDLVFACLSLFGVYFLAFLILRDKVAAFFAVLLFSVDAWVLRAGASGLGFSLALFLAVVSLWYGFRREYGVASFVCGFLILSAPLEGMLLWGVLMIDAIAVWRREGVVPARLIRSVALVLASVGPWIVYALHASASPFEGLPVESFTGTPFAGPAGEGSGLSLLWFAASGGILIVLLVAGHVQAVRRSDWRLLAPSSFPLIWAFAAVAINVAFNPGGVFRSWVLVSPVLVIFGFLGLYYLSLFWIGIGQRSTVALLVVVVAILLANQIVYRAKVLPDMNRTTLEMEQQVRPMAHWLRARIDGTKPLIAPFGGMIGWITRTDVKTPALLWNGNDSDARASVHAASSSSRIAAVIDRSVSSTRLSSGALVPLRTWGSSGGEGVSYTAYVDPALRDSLAVSGLEHNPN